MGKVYILIDSENIVRCLASEECNLHEDKLWMTKYRVDRKGIVGDEYTPETSAWTPRPENYPKPSPDEVIEKKIKKEMESLLRDQAIKNLKKKGELDPWH